MDWSGVAVSTFSVFFSRFIVHRVGYDAEGVWALIFSVLESAWMMDLAAITVALLFASPERIAGNQGLSEYDKATMLRSRILNICFHFFERPGTIQPDRSDLRNPNHQTALRPHVR